MKSGTMKKIRYAMVGVVCLVTVATYASQQQSRPADGDSKGGKIEALRIAFISQRLNLTPEEAEKFWPVFNLYRSDLNQLRKNFKLGPGSPPLTAEQQLDFEQQKLDLKKKYKNQFEAVIGPDKVNMLYNLEDEFRQKLKEFHEQRERERGQGPPPAGGPGGPHK